MVTTPADNPDHSADLAAAASEPAEHAAPAMPDQRMDPDAFAPGFDKRSAWATLAVMTLGMVVSTLNATTMNTSLAVIMDEFSVSPGTVQWLTTAYMLCLGVVTPLSAHLMARFRIRPLYCAALGVFALGAALGVVQHNFALLIVARCIQAMGSGITIPTVQVVALSIFPYRMRGMANGVSIGAVGVAPALGPVLAGVLTDTVGWRAIFVITGALSLVTMGAAWVMLRRLHDGTERRHLDVASVLLSTAAAVSLVFGCVNMGTMGIASPWTLAPLAAGVALTAVFVVRELKVDEPLLDVHALRCRPFALACLAVVFTQGYILATNSMVCLYVQDVQGYSATLSGLTMLPGALLSIVAAPTAGRILDRRGPRGVVAFGFTLVIVATWLMSNMAPQTPLWQPVAFQTVRFVGMSCLQQILMTWGISSLGRLRQGAAIGNSIRQLGGSLTNALLFSLMDMVMLPAVPSMGQAAAEGLAITTTFTAMNATQVLLAALVIGSMVLQPQIRSAAVRAR